MSKKNKKNTKKKNNIQNNSKSNQLKNKPNNDINKATHNISKDLKDSDPSEILQPNTVHESPNNKDKISNTEKLEENTSTDSSQTVSSEENNNKEIATTVHTPIEDIKEDINTDNSLTMSSEESNNKEIDTPVQISIDGAPEEDISIDNLQTVPSEENNNKEIDTTVQTPIEDTTSKANNSKLEQQARGKTNKTITHKKKKIVAICTTTALLSFLASIAIIKSSQKNNIVQSNDAFIQEIENMISVENIGKKLETKKLIDNNTIFTVDYTFDSRFELFKDNILEVYTKVSNSDENFEEVFIIKNNNTERVEEYLNVYKANLINRYKNNKYFKKTLDIVEKTIINSEKGITYFIASNKKEDIEKMIINEINI